MIEIVKVLNATAAGGYRLRIQFSNGSEGETELSALIQQGGKMVEPLADKSFFSRVFVRSGVPAWPNGFEIDAIALYQDMKASGQLKFETART